MKKEKSNIIIYQTDSGEIKLRADFDNETLWATQAQIAELFNVNPQAITKHLTNIYNEKELLKKSTCSKVEQVRIEGNRKVKRSVLVYNLDAVISVGYRINSNTGTKFRQWATKTLKDHIAKGYTINKSRIKKNYEQFLKTVDDIKMLSKNNSNIETGNALELVKVFASTWFSLNAYDKNSFPKKGYTKKTVSMQAKELYDDIEKLKQSLIEKGEATDFFGRERTKNTLEGILGNIFQSAFGKDVYETVEEKASHFLYFIIKDHPFIDGNKRSAAFSFIWFLNKAGLDFRRKITPEVLTALTLFIVESNSRDKDRIIGLVILLLKIN